ncbi:hypothetical protein A9Q99_01600 [Gammaproteobacteria bacterium 45_16_T64]|nr:hypothetical protein A9Q99_01600 [Gammaproteobacteria bacterium 45_16_T64]
MRVLTVILLVTMCSILFVVPAISSNNIEINSVNIYFNTLNIMIVLSALLLTGWTGKLAKAMLLASACVCILSILITGGMLSSGAFHSILATNIDEIYGYFMLIDWLPVIVFSLIFLCASILIFRCQLYLPKPVRVMVFGLTVALLFGYPGFRFSVDTAYSKDVREDPFSALYIFPDMPSYNLYLVASLAMHERSLSTSPYGTSLPDHVHTLPVAEDNSGDLILILGESSRRHSYSIYGEPINTTPNLKKRALHSPNFTKIEDVFSPAPNTRESVARSLSFATSDTYLHEGLPFKTLLGALSEADYHTVWITTQDLYTRWDTFSAKVANSADEVIHKNPNNGPWTDEIAASYAVEELRKPRKSFVILHLWGEHSDYGIRNGQPIPDTSIQAIKEHDDAKERSKEEIEYLASIHHTDEIIESIFSHIDTSERSDLAIYFPDHGEVIGKGHGLVPIDIDSELSIPMVAQGKQSRELIAEIDRFRDSEYGIFNTSYFPEVMINLLGGEASPPLDSLTLSFYSIQGHPSHVGNQYYE